MAQRKRRLGSPRSPVRSPRSSVHSLQPVCGLRKQRGFHPISGLSAAERSIVSRERSLIRRIHYPRLTLLVVITLLAYVMLYGKPHTEAHALLLSLGYIGVFLSGILYAYGMTAPTAALILLSLAKDGNILLAGLVGGLGALVGDLMIFFFIRSTFSCEIDRIAKNHFVVMIENEEKRIMGHFQKYFLSAFASFLIASPLPTEIGVSLMASRKHLSAAKFAAIAYGLHTSAILLILLAGGAV